MKTVTVTKTYDNDGRVTSETTSTGQKLPSVKGAFGAVGRAAGRLVGFVKAHRAQLWRAVRLAAAVIASTGIVDQVVHGTATKAGIIAAATAAVEVVYRAFRPTVPAVKATPDAAA